MKEITFSFADIKYDESTKTVLYIWKGYAHDDEIKDAVLKALDMVKDTHSHKMLFDTRKAPTFTPAYQEWQTKEYLPLLTKAGVKGVAVVIPGNVIKDKVVGRLVDAVDTFNIASFSSLEEAIKWLK